MLFVCNPIYFCGKYHAHMPIARMYLHITRTQQGAEICYISSRHFCKPALSYLHYTTIRVGIVVQLILQLIEFNKNE